jgi:hypothetical protein
MLNCQTANTNYFKLSFELVSGMMQAGVPKDKILAIMNWFSFRTWNSQSGVRGEFQYFLNFLVSHFHKAFLGLVMAFSKAILDPIANIEYCTIVHCMARNGYEFGIRLSATGDQWYNAPAPLPEGCKSRTCLVLLSHSFTRTLLRKLSAEGRGRRHGRLGHHRDGRIRSLCARRR